VASPPNQTTGGDPAIDPINVSFERTGGGDISKLIDYRLGSKSLVDANTYLGEPPDADSYHCAVVSGVGAP
jgi:hypothetical protein